MNATTLPLPETRESSAEVAWRMWDLATEPGSLQENEGRIMTRFDRAIEIQEFLAAHAANPQPVLDRLERAEHEAMLWHVVSLCMPEIDRAQVERIAAEMLAGGYRRDADPAQMPLAI